MGKKIRIESGGVSTTADLYDNDTSTRIYETLPIEGTVSRWGEEIYFSIPVKLAEAGDSRQDMQVGELGYWPPGNAFCIFFGRTPASSDETPRAASDVNPFGKIIGDATQFSAIRNGERILISAVE
jgi:hypothetical protein